MKNLVTQLENRKKSLEFQTRMHTGLVSHNYIVEVGAYTVASENGRSKLVNIASGKLPSQWTIEGVKEIKEKCSWDNMLGKKMEIKAIPYKDWYAKELKSVNETLQIFKK